MKRTNSLEGVWPDGNQLWSWQPKVVPFQATSFMSVGGTDTFSIVISKGLLIMHALIKWVVQWLKTSLFVLRWYADCQNRTSFRELLKAVHT